LIFALLNTARGLDDASGPNVKLEVIDYKDVYEEKNRYCLAILGPKEIVDEVYMILTPLATIGTIC
jgi:hypothetical protein